MNVIIQKLNACGTSSSGRVRSELRSWRLRTGAGRDLRSARLPGSQDLRTRLTYGSRVALTTAGDDDGGSQRLEIGGFYLRKRDVCGNADHDDGREGLF